jgi:1,4-dihydroxy-6-naphthoate synthase
MEEDVMRKHIELYVNDYTKELGEKGQAAVEKLYEVYNRINEQAEGLKPQFIH